ncbi:MAG: hypothetical protein IPG04_04815 [Polyangiaceae bacterium]|nr:hypothetical protein [Polyangiaceae bacterium]
MPGGTSFSIEVSCTGTLGFATVSTDGVTPWDGRYFASLSTRPTPTPPDGGHMYVTSNAVAMGAEASRLARLVST